MIFKSFFHCFKKKIIPWRARKISGNVTISKKWNFLQYFAAAAFWLFILILYSFGISFQVSSRLSVSALCFYNKTIIQSVSTIASNENLPIIIFGKSTANTWEQLINFKINCKILVHEHRNGFLKHPIPLFHHHMIFCGYFHIILPTLSASLTINCVAINQVSSFNMCFTSAFNVDIARRIRLHGYKSRLCKDI